MKASGAEVNLIDGPSSHDATQYGLISLISMIVICIGTTLTWRRLRRCRMQTFSNISTPHKGAAPLPAPAAPPAPVRPSARATHAQRLAGRPPPRAASEHHHRVEHVPTTSVHVSDESDIEISNLRSATLVNKATSPCFRNHFNQWNI